MSTDWQCPLLRHSACRFHRRTHPRLGCISFLNTVSSWLQEDAVAVDTARFEAVARLTEIDAELADTEQSIACKLLQHKLWLHQQLQTAEATRVQLKVCAILYPLVLRPFLPLQTLSTVKSKLWDDEVFGMDVKVI